MTANQRREEQEWEAQNRDFHVERCMECHSRILNSTRFPARNRKPNVLHICWIFETRNDRCYVLVIKSRPQEIDRSVAAEVRDEVQNRKLTTLGDNHHQSWRDVVHLVCNISSKVLLVSLFQVCPDRCFRPKEETTLPSDSDKSPNAISEHHLSTTY